jgi:K+-sensing histidine kinase KdpD
LLRPAELIAPVFFLAIMLSALVGGIGPGLLGALLRTLAIDYFFLPPLANLVFDSVHVLQLLVFFVSALLVSVSSWSATGKRAETLLQERVMNGRRKFRTDRRPQRGL